MYEEKGNRVYDVLVVGGGVIGSAVARELCRYQLSVGVLEKNYDVCCETSGRNSAVVHGGFAYDTGTLKAELCLEGCLEFGEVADELDVPFKRTGKVLVGSSAEDLKSLEATMETGKRNGCRGLEIIDRHRLQELAPYVLGEFALYSPMSGILDPFNYTIALAENAVMNGAAFHFDCEVTGIEREQSGAFAVRTSQGGFGARWIVNCAGQGCGSISEMLGNSGYRLGYSKGNYLILDKKVGYKLPLPVYPVPSNTYMGIHVTPTVDGNVTVGPDAYYVEDTSYYGVPQERITFLQESVSNLWPHVRREDFIRNYSGMLTKWLDDEGLIQDFRIEARGDCPNTVNLIGIESPGLTAALPIARRVVKLVQEQENLKLRDNFNPRRKGIKPFRMMTREEQCRLIKENPDYGEIVCRCEKVTKAELLQAIRNPLGVRTMTGIKYRTRAMMGRCQGGYCQMRMAEMIQKELSCKPEELIYSRKGSWLFAGEVRP